jgi:hypothetical protein
MRPEGPQERNGFRWHQACEPKSVIPCLEDGLARA